MFKTILASVAVASLTAAAIPASAATVETRSAAALPAVGVAAPADAPIAVQDVARSSATAQDASEFKGFALLLILLVGGTAALIALLNRSNG